MILTETDLAGAFVIDVERHEDRRGYFSRVFCVEELSAPGLGNLDPASEPEVITARQER